ncbi:MAG: protein kinase, partial [Litoreibacter sp.]
MGNPLASDSNEEEEFGADELAPGTELLRGQYIIESFLNAGGFGITYLAKDSLERKVVIKECFPGSFCRRSRMIVHARSRAHQAELKSIVRLFVQEARSLAKLIHPNIVGVHQVFEDNDTAYMALDFVEGRDLLDTLEDPNHGLKPDQITRILRSMLDAVGFIHDQGMLHRDISPDNILLDGAQRPVLIDFGAAREEATKKSRVLSAMRVVKDGYSPQEFYISGSEQTPSSDLYALGATFYHLITGEAPPNSQTRLASLATGESDPYQNLAENHTDNDYDKNVLRSIDMALAVLPKDRVQSAQDWLNIIDGVEGDNITALRPTSGSNAAAAAASEAAAKPKSKVGLLLASVAAVALIGVGVISSGVLDSTPAVEVDGATATTPAIEEPVQSAEIAPIIEEAASTPTDEAVAEAEIVPETVETPGVDTAEIAPDVVAPEAAETQDSSLTEEAAPVVVDTAATDSADGTPADVAENPAKTAEELLAAGEIELVEETSITDADVTGEEEIALLDDTSTSDTPVEAETNLAKTAEELLAAGEIELVEETSTTEADVT